MRQERKNKSRRRTNGEGSIFREKSGRYRIAVTRWEGGKRVRKTKIAWTNADALAALEELRGDTTVPTGEMTVATYLQRWLKNSVDQEKQPSTYDSYKNAINNHISNRIGHHRIKKLTAIHVEEWLAEMKRQEVGTRTIENAFKILRSAMVRAVALDLIAKNPCGAIDKPSHEAEQISPFTLQESRLLLSATQGHRYHAVLQLALTAGMRQGEIFGLEWKNIDWKKKTVTISQQVISVGGETIVKAPKSKASIRTIMLTDGCLEALRQHQSLMLKEGHGGNKFVFCAPEGGLIGRSTFRSRFWQPLLKTMKPKAIPHRGFHHTRHTYATLALGASVPLPVVSKNLGHSKVSITSDIYAHVLEEHATAATKTMSRLLG